MRFFTSIHIRKKQIVSLLALELIFLPLHAEPGKDAVPEEPLPKIEVLEKFDDTRNKASSYITRFGNWFDNFFADDLIYNEQQGSYIKLHLLQTYYEDDKPLYDAQIKAKLDIPKTQQKLQLFFESLDEDEEDKQQISIDQTIDNQEQTLGLRFLSLDANIWKITTIGAVRFHEGLDPLIRLRLRRLVTDGPLAYRFTENIFWYNSSGAGETTRQDIDYSPAEKFLFRSTTQATWLNYNHYFDLGQDFVLYQNINKRKSVAYQVGARGITESGLHKTDYFYLVDYRQQIHRKWLFLDLIPAIHHPEDNDFKPIRSLTLKLEIVFDAR